MSQSSIISLCLSLLIHLPLGMFWFVKSEYSTDESEAFRVRLERATEVPAPEKVVRDDSKNAPVIKKSKKETPKKQTLGGQKSRVEKKAILTKKTSNPIKTIPKRSATRVKNRSSFQTTAKFRKVKEDYFSRLSKLIAQHKYYPVLARKRGLTGVVKVEILVLPDGRFGQVSMKKSSGHQVLDQAAIEAVKRAGKGPAFPKYLGNAPLRLTQPFSFFR